MMQSKKNLFLTYLCLVGMLLAFVVGCNEDKNTSNSPPTTPGKIDGLPGDPGPGNLAGKVVGTINKQPLEGITILVNSRTTTTASDGTFLLEGVGEGNLGVVASDDSVYTRTQAVNTSAGRSVLLDVLEKNSNFNLKFYREIARGYHPLERDIFPTHRWTNPTPPTFYINTNGQAANDGVIDQKDIDTVARVLREIVPAFTANFYSSIRIETAFFPSNATIGELPDHSFIISFDDSLIQLGAYGVTYTQPDFISPTTSAIRKVLIFLLDDDRYYEASTPGRISFEEIIAHESGHGLGFRHTSEASFGGLPSVMVKTGKYGGMYSEHDLLHMGIVYQRPAGNTDIDNDPLPGAGSKLANPKPFVFLDQRANFPITAEQHRTLNRLEGFHIVKELVAEHQIFY